ncbi:MAG: hypothetical protein LQ352_007921 [Teloschistes flavicans]|nr:MAG: hypothetical protein LQ352_007921 [Teloschistes flavicans]
MEREVIRILLDNHTLRIDEVDQPDCPICICPYGSLPSSELPVKIPGCGHIFGRKCIAQWLGRHSNTCPLCRAPVHVHVHVDESADARCLRIYFARWRIHAERHRPNSRSLFMRLSQYDRSYWRLCEDIVSLIERRCARSSQSEWGDIISYYDIVEQGTFYRLQYVINHRGGYRTMMDRLRGLLPYRFVVDDVMADVRRDRIVTFEATTMQIMDGIIRVLGYDERISRAHHNMYARLYPAGLYPPRTEPDPSDPELTRALGEIHTVAAEERSDDAEFDEAVADVHSSIAALRASNTQLNETRGLSRLRLPDAERFSLIEELQSATAELRSSLEDLLLSNPYLEPLNAELHSSTGGPLPSNSETSRSVASRGRPRAPNGRFISVRSSNSRG